VTKLAPEALWIELAHQPVGLIDSAKNRRELNLLHGKPIGAFCGIGNPAGFQHTMATCGLNVVALRELPDHATYDAAAIAGLDTWAAAQVDIQAIVCTHKDLVKIPRDQIGGVPLWALMVELVIVTGQGEFEEKLSDVLQ